MLSTPIEEAEPISALENQPVLAATEALGVPTEAASGSTFIDATAALDLLDAAIRATSAGSQGDLNADQLTGLEQSGPAESGRLLTENLSPLLEPAIESDTFLVRQAGSSEPVSIQEDRAFSLDLRSLFPEASRIESVQFAEGSEPAHISWIDYEQRLPDATLADRLVIEGIFIDQSGNRVELGDIASLMPGSELLVDVVVTDTRNNGSGLIGLDIDLHWNPDALGLGQVEIAPTLPLFRESGRHDSASGSLNGLVGAALPNSGNGEALGDTWHDIFSTITFETKAGITSGIGLEIRPNKLPARGNLPVNLNQIVSVDSNSTKIPVLFGLAEQEQVGLHNLELRARDVDGQVWHQTLNLTVANVNDAPVAIPQMPLTILEDRDFEISLTDIFSDEDSVVGDRLNYKLTGIEPDWLELDGTAGILRGRPSNKEVGAWEVDVTAWDQLGAKAQQRLKITVENVNDAPEWNGVSLPEIWVRQNQPFEIQLPAKAIVDVDSGDQLIYSLDTTEAEELTRQLSIDPATGLISGLLKEAQDTPIRLSVIATDRAGAKAQVPISVRVVDHSFNRSPYQIGEGVKDQTIREGELYAIDVNGLFQDDDIMIGDSISMRIESPEWLQFNPVSGKLSGLADNSAVGRHQIKLQAVDQWGASTRSSFWLDVENTNEAPQRLTGSFDERQLLAETTLWLNIANLFSDEDQIHGDILTYGLEVHKDDAPINSNNLRFDAATGNLIFSPSKSDLGLHKFVMSATDQAGASSSYLLNLNVVTDDGRAEDQRQQHESDEIEIAPTLRLSESGELVKADSLSDLPSGTKLTMRVDINDWRPASTQPGVIGLDLDLRWTGLRLLATENSFFEASISDAFPLFRQVDRSRLEDNRLGISGASLPGLGIGSALGDSRDEVFFSLDFELVNPAKPIRLDLKLNDESFGGLGIGMADGSSADQRLRIRSLSSNTLIDLLMRQGAEQAEALRRLVEREAQRQRLTASSSILQSLSPSGMGASTDSLNRAPVVIRTIGNTALNDNRKLAIELSDLFDFPDRSSGRGSSLSYSLNVFGKTPAQTEQLSRLIRIDTSSKQPRLTFSTPGLMEIISGRVEVIASNSGLSTSQSFELEVIPTAEMIGIQADTQKRYNTNGKPVSLGTLLQAEPLQIEDKADEAELVIRSTEPISLRLSASFRRLSGLSKTEAEDLEKMWRANGRRENKASETEFSIPVSDLLLLIDKDDGSFDLRWIEIMPEANDTGSLGVAVSTRSRVRGDDGTRFGIQQSPWLQTRLIIPKLEAEDNSNPAESTQRVAKTDGKSAASKPKTSDLPFERSSGAGGAAQALRQRTIDPTRLTTDQNIMETLRDKDDGNSQAKGFKPTWTISHEQESLSEWWLQQNAGRQEDSGGIKKLLGNILDTVRHPASLAGFILTMMTMPGGGERGLRSILLKSKVGRAIHLQRRNQNLKAQWQLQLPQPDGQKLLLNLQLHQGQLVLSHSDQKQDDHNHADHLVAMKDTDDQSSLWNVLNSSTNPGAIMAEISRTLDRVLRCNDQEVDWHHWLNRITAHSRGSDASRFKTDISHLRQSVMLSQAVDLGIGDALMLRELLHCHVRLGGTLPWLQRDAVPQAY